MAKLCMGCMNPLPEGSEVCSICGFNPATDRNPDICLPIASVLQGHYIVGRCIGQTGDQLVYRAYDRQMKEPCFVQEYFPGSISRREPEGGVQPLDGCQRVFGEHADEFRSMMRTLARMRELPAMIPVYDIFEENGTVYAVSDYCEGMTLTRKLKLAGGRLPWSEARPLFMSLLTTLTRLNEAGITHLGLCPDNILIGKDGKPRLWSFSIAAARRAGTDLAPKMVSGYAAPEQYGMEGTITAAADVYGLAATIFRAVTGNEPPAGNSRAKNSDDLFMPAEVAEELTQQACIALFNALQVAPESRTATMAELRDQLSVEPNVSALVDEAKADMGDDLAADVIKKSKSGRSTLLVVLICCLVVLLIALGVLAWLLWGKEQEKQIDSSSTTPPPSFATSTTLDPNVENQVAVPNLVGKSYYDFRDKKMEGDLTVVLSYVAYNDKAAGTILFQDPPANDVVNKGSVISLTISNGRKDESIVIPDLSGWKEEHAKLYLEALGLEVAVMQVQVSTFDKGEVDGIDPAIGSTVLMGEKVTLRVSNVEQTEAVPDTTTDSDYPGYYEDPDTTTDEDNGYFGWP